MKTKQSLSWVILILGCIFALTSYYYSIQLEQYKHAIFAVLSAFLLGQFMEDLKKEIQ